MTTIPDVPDPTTPANRFTPDAQERIARLRTMSVQFRDDVDPRPLTVSEVRLARSTSAATLESAATFVEAAPSVGSSVANAGELRDALAFELAYAGVRDEARALARQIDHAILRRKLKATRAARAVYRMAKGFLTVDAGDAVRPHVTELKRSLATRRRRRTAPPTEAPLAAKQ